MKNQDALNYFVELTKQLYKQRLEKIILFGSYARKEDSEHSDVDLLIILNDDKIKFSKESKALSQLVTDTAVEKNIWVSPKPTNLSSFLNSNIPLFNIIKNEGIVIYG